MNLDPIPLQEPIVTTAKGEALYLESGWARWLSNGLNVRLGTTPTQVGHDVALTNQAASIGATPLPVAALSAGLYRVSYYARITTPDSVSSSLTVTLGWTESGLPLILSGAPMAGNSVTTVQTGTWVVQLDGQSTLTYATVYASASGQMRYRLSMLAEALP